MCDLSAPGHRSHTAVLAAHYPPQLPKSHFRALENVTYIIIIVLELNVVFWSITFYMYVAQIINFRPITYLIIVVMIVVRVFVFICLCSARAYAAGIFLPTQFCLFHTSAYAAGAVLFLLISGQCVRRRRFF